jgi:hypothetical protein
VDGVAEGQDLMFPDLGQNLICIFIVINVSVGINQHD